MSQRQPGAHLSVTNLFQIIKSWTSSWLKDLRVYRKPVWGSIKRRLPSWGERAESAVLGCSLLPWPANSMTGGFVSRNHWLHGPLPLCNDRVSSTLSAGLLANLSLPHLFHMKCNVKTALGCTAYGEMVLVSVKPMIKVVILKYFLIGIITSKYNYSILNYLSFWTCSGRTSKTSGCPQTSVWEPLSSVSKQLL